MTRLAGLVLAVGLAAAPTARAATGGPDAYGYMWDDSYSYAWFDASTSGTQLGGSGFDNYNWAGIPLGFSMNFYGTVYTSVNVCSNGWLSFTDATSVVSGANVSIPDPALPNAMIAVLKEDLNPNGANSPAGYLYYQQTTISGQPSLVVEWRNVLHSGAQSRYYVEAILRADGHIILQYQSVSTFWNAWQHAIGIEDQAGLVGLQYPGIGSCNNNCGRAVHFYPGNPTATPTPLPPTYSPPYFDDFEGGKPPTDWKTAGIGGSNTSWVRRAPQAGNSTPVAPAAYSATNCWGSNLNNGEFYSDEESYLVSPEFVLPTGFLVNFTWRNWYSFETGADAGRVELSTNGGISWTGAVPTTGYPDTAFASPIFPNLPAYSHLTNGASWNLQTVDLSSYSGQNVRVRFHLGADNGTQTAGWYVDDVAVNLPGTPTPTATVTPTYPSSTPTATFDTNTYTISPTPTWTRTLTSTISWTPSVSWTPSASLTYTPTIAAGGEVAAWPNPFTVGADPAVHFANVPVGSRILLYTYNGTQVRRLDKTGADPTWDGKNDSKERVRPGPYYYVITVPGGRRYTGTLYVRIQ